MIRQASIIGPIMQQVLAHDIHNAESIRIRNAIVDASEANHSVSELLAEMQSHFRVHNPQATLGRERVEAALKGGPLTHDKIEEYADHLSAENPRL